MCNINGCRKSGPVNIIILDQWLRACYVKVSMAQARLLQLWYFIDLFAPAVVATQLQSQHPLLCCLNNNIVVVKPYCWPKHQSITTLAILLKNLWWTKLRLLSPIFSFHMSMLLCTIGFLSCFCFSCLIVNFVTCTNLQWWQTSVCLVGWTQQTPIPPLWMHLNPHTSCKIKTPHFKLIISSPGITISS